MKDFAFGKENFIVIGIAVVLIIIGFLLMSGGGSNDDTFNPAIFSTRRIVIAPIITVAGFALVVYGVVRKPKDDVDNQITEKK